jgi:hypothetical protein
MERPDCQEIAWPRELIAAVGVCILAFNRAEENLRRLLQRYLRAPAEARFLISEALHNRERVNLVRALIGSVEPDPALKASLQHALKAFDICAENRNFIAHMVLVTEERRGLYVVLKRSDARRSSRDLYTVELEELALCSRAIDELNSYFDEVEALLGYRLPRGPLRGKPPLPRKLRRHRLEEAQLDAPPPPQP